MGILFGLAAALCWGAGDFIAGRVSRLVGVIQTMFYIQLGGLVCTGALLWLRPGAPALHVSAWALAGAIALGNFIGTLLLYRAFAIGQLSLVSPIASGFAIVTALLSLAAGERPAPLALTGAALLIGGVVVISRATEGEGAESRIENREPRADRSPLSVVRTPLLDTTDNGLRTTDYRQNAQPTTRNRLRNSQFSILHSQFPKGVPEALGVAVCFGSALWGLNYVTPSLGILWPVLVTRAVQTFGALLLLVGRKAAPAPLSRTIWLLILSAAVFDTLAFLAFNTGLATMYTSIVTALASLFSAVTILLAAVFLRERLSSGQWLGVGVTLAGVLLVSL
jgi:drug/metabolite transporter (DMT)-like permease